MATTARQRLVEGTAQRANAVGDVEPSAEDAIETVVCSAARVVAVYDRAVLLTMTERRRLWREWGEADSRALAGSES